MGENVGRDGKRGGDGKLGEKEVTSERRHHAGGESIVKEGLHRKERGKASSLLGLVGRGVGS